MQKARKARRGAAFRALVFCDRTRIVLSGECAQLCGDIGLLVGVQVGVDAEGRVHTVMPQPLGDQERREAQLDQHGGMTMPEVVDADTRHACAFCGLAQRGRDVAGGAAEQQVGAGGVVEPFDIGLQLGAKLVGYGNGAHAVFRFWRRDDIPAAAPVAGFGDRNGFGREINVLDGQRKAFAAPHPCPEQNLINGVQLGIGDACNHLTVLVYRPELHGLGVPLADARFIAAGVAHKAIILFCKLKHGGKVVVDRPQVGGTVCSLHHSRLPLVDHQRRDRADRNFAEGRQDFVAENMLLFADRAVAQADGAGLHVLFV